MIDTHAHIFLDQFDADLDSVIASARTAGISKILLPDIDSSTTDSMLEVSKKYPDFCLPMIGLHPCSVKENYKSELGHVEAELSRGGYIAIGEIGTDLYWDKTFWPEQQEAFNFQCELALANQLPVVIHCRESIPETIELIKPWARKGLTGVFHCFTGSLDQANEITEMDFYLGFGGVSTFKNGGMDKVIPFVNRERSVLETDSPYLAPTPHRGKRNEPAFIKLIAQKVAEFWDMDVEQVDAITTENAKRLFHLP